MAQPDQRPGDPNVARQLREARVSAGLSQEELGRRLGLRHSQISRIENALRSTGIDVVRAWFRECGYELDAIHVGPSHRASPLLAAIAELPEEELDAITTIVSAWPRLSERVRGRILGLIESDEA